MSVWTTIGAISGASSVMLGAFGAHGLRSRVSDPKLLETWQTAAYYHMLHSVVLTVVPLISPRHYVSSRLFSAGMLMFSGSLYLLVLTEQKKLGAITPLGGAALIGGWIALAARR